MILDHKQAIEKSIQDAPVDLAMDTPSKCNASTHRGLVEFETRYSEAQRKAADKRAKRQYESEVAEGLKPETTRHLIEAAELRRLVHERLENGFVLPFITEIAGRHRQPFVELGLRSDENPILKLFVSLVPAGGKARASNDKATLDVQSRSKLLTLDYAYIELNKEFLGAIRIDCDGVFASPAHLLHELELLVKVGEIPCLPHVIVGDLMDDGTYRRPHLIFLLPPGSAVWKSEDKRCRMNIVRLLIGVHSGLTKAMLAIGADPAAPATTMRMKNPLSPIWHAITPNWQHMPTLSEYAEWVDTKTSRHVLVRRAAAVQSAMGIRSSNLLFNNLRDQAVKLLIEWHFNADVRIATSKAALADHLHIALERHAKDTGLDDLQIGYVIGKVADYMAFDFDPAKLQGRRNRGRILHIVDGMKSVQQRQKAGSDYSNGVRKARSLDRLVSAYRTMLERSEELSPETLASRAGVARSTAYRHFAACQQICASECIDKKEGFSPCTDNTNHISETPKGAGSQATFGVSDGINVKEDLNTFSLSHPESEDDDVRSIEEHQTWLAAQNNGIEAHQTHLGPLDGPDTQFEDEPHLTALETAFYSKA